jgi:hypothetical protein
MWVAVTFAAIGFAGTGFMVWFLLAVLREGRPSVCYWVVPVGRESGNEMEMLELVGGSFGEGDCLETEWNRGDYCSELLENESHGKEECSSGLIALDVRPASASLGWRPIHSGVYVLRERRL